MKKILSIILIAVILTTCVGCSDTMENDVEKFNIVTSFYPMYVATANLIEGIDDVSLTCLASPTVGCLHDYQLTVKDMKTLETADVFVINGGGMESFLDKAISTYPDLKTINASENILEDIEKHEEHDHEENSHVWVGISLHIRQVENICEKLKKIDPKNESKYEENKNTYVAKLEELKDRMHKDLDNVEKKNIVTFHEAFEYFAEEFGLNVVAVIEREPGTSPSAGEVAEIINKINKNDVNAIFVEPQYSKTSADTIAKETNVSVYELDPVVTGELNKDAYINIMNKNLTVLMEALK